MRYNWGRKILLTASVLALLAPGRCVAQDAATSKGEDDSLSAIMQREKVAEEERVGGTNYQTDEDILKSRKEDARLRKIEYDRAAQEQETSYDYEY